MSHDLDEDDLEDFEPEMVDIPITNSDCCDAPTETVDGLLTCTQCGEVCNPKN